MIELLLGSEIGDNAALKLLKSLGEHPSISWPQVDPQILFDFISRLHPEQFNLRTEETLGKLIVDYLNARGYSAKPSGYIEALAKLENYARTSPPGKKPHASRTPHPARASNRGARQGIKGI
jgi:hypothetical protein